MKVPVIVTALSALTGLVAMANVVLVEFAGTLIETGTVALLPLLFNVTVIPPDGALLVRVTVPSALEPPMTESGEIVTLAKVGGVT